MTMNTRNVFFGPQVIQNIKNEQFRGTNNKKMFYLHFDCHFVPCSYEGEFRGNFGFFHPNLIVSNFYFWSTMLGGGSRVVASTAAFHARVRGSVPGLGGLKETNYVSSPSTCGSQYCGEPPWPRGSVLGLRPSGLEFRILCLEDSVISIISPSSGGSPGPV